MLTRVMQDTRGTTSVEFAIIVTLFLVFMFGIIDFGRVMWLYNSATKATERGARYAVVHNFVAKGLENFDCLAASGGNGVSCPESAIDPNPVICNSLGCNGYGPLDSAAFNNIVSVMQNYSDIIRAENVTIEYRHLGIGLSGNPYGSDITPLVTIRLSNLVINTLASDLLGIASFTMPPFKTSLMGEDLSD